MRAARRRWTVIRLAYPAAGARGGGKRRGWMRWGIRPGRNIISDSGLTGESWGCAIAAASGCLPAGSCRARRAGRRIGFAGSGGYWRRRPGAGRRGRPPRPPCGSSRSRESAPRWGGHRLTDRLTCTQFQPITAGNPPAPEYPAALLTRRRRRGAAAVVGNLGRRGDEGVGAVVVRRRRRRGFASGTGVRGWIRDRAGYARRGPATPVFLAQRGGSGGQSPPDENETPVVVWVKRRPDGGIAPGGWAWAMAWTMAMVDGVGVGVGVDVDGDG